MADKVCIVTGVGDGTGRAIVERFATGGYTVAMIARNEERLARFAAEIPGTSAFVCDVRDETSVIATVDEIVRQHGAPAVLVNNAVSFDALLGNFLEIAPDNLQQNFAVNTMGLLYCARAVTPYMLDAGHGAIMVTGNTSARRGRANFAAFAPTKAAQRILAESIARSLGPQGIHVSFMVIDGGIDMPFARELLPDKLDDFFIKTSSIADSIWHVVHQDPSGWTFELDLRPFGEDW
ncbi:MAG: NAD(P)-dependent dehydrogenase (short-subunit alcohol dehydrogenase family) [Gammaproteobacteria bacterium]|jgi:NAD(P)-dependent dehydrogenase (short-subunit alcohol dehydrogenase family)